MMTAREKCEADETIKTLRAENSTSENPLLGESVGEGQS